MDVFSSCFFFSFHFFEANRRFKSFPSPLQKKHIKSDYVVGLMEQFAGQVCQLPPHSQEHDVCRLANHQAPFILPPMPFNFITVTADSLTHTPCFLPITHTHTFAALYHDGYLLLRRRRDHLANGAPPLPAVVPLC